MDWCDERQLKISRYRGYYRRDLHRTTRRQRQQAQGADFIRQVERTLSEIAVNPDAGNLFAGSRFRRRLLRSFPFGVVYQLDGEDTSVIAVTPAAPPNYTA